MGRNEQCKSGTTQSFFLVQLSFITSVAVIFHKKELHDNDTLLITSLFEHLIQIRDNMPTIDKRNTRICAHTIVIILCHVLS